VAEAIRFYFDKNWTKFDIPLKDASPDFKKARRNNGHVYKYSYSGKGSKPNRNA
jgi:hypothetical protein